MPQYKNIKVDSCSHSFLIKLSGKYISSIQSKSTHYSGGPTLECYITGLLSHAWTWNHLNVSIWVDYIEALRGKWLELVIHFLRIHRNGSTERTILTCPSEPECDHRTNLYHAKQLKLPIRKKHTGAPVAQFVEACSSLQQTRVWVRPVDLSCLSSSPRFLCHL